MAATASPAFGGHRRSSTAPDQLPQQTHDRGADVSEEPDEILFEHPKVDVYTFNIPSKLGSPYASPRSPQGAGALPWKSNNETIIGLDRPLRLRRPKAGAPFLQVGTKAREHRVTLMPNTEMWCVDDRSKFATVTGQSVFRIQFPCNEAADETSVETFKNVLKPIIRYEPTDVPCPFKRESKSTVQTKDDVESGQRRPKRTLIGVLENLKKSPGDVPSRRHSDWIRRPLHLRSTSGNEGSDNGNDDDASPAAADQGELEDTPEEVEAENEETVAPVVASDPNEPLLAETVTSMGQRRSLPDSTTAEHDHNEQHKPDMPADASDTSDSNASPQLGSSPVESPSASSEDSPDAEPQTMFSEFSSGTKELRDGNDITVASKVDDQPDFEPQPSTQEVSSSSPDEEDSASESASESDQQDQLQDASASETPREPLAVPTQRLEVPTPPPAIPPVPPPPEAAAEDDSTSESVSESASESDQQDPPPDTSASEPPNKPAEIHNPPPTPAAATVEESSPLRFRATAAKPPTPEPQPHVFPPPPTPSKRSSSPTVNPNRQLSPSTSDPNAYILTRLIDLLTSPPWKFFGALLDLVRAISDRALGSLDSASTGATGPLKLPRTPGRWVDSEEGSEADEGAVDGADATATGRASEDDWDLDDSDVDDYGMPLGNTGSARAGRLKAA